MTSALLLMVLAVSTPQASAEAGSAPSLVVPDGFVAELLLEAPDLRWPSAVHALRDGSLLVAEDPMDMIGPTDQPCDRILRLTFDEQGRVAGKTVFADGLFATFGIAQVDDAVLVMNMPHLTRLRDLDGDGVAEAREELIRDLGPPAPGWPGGFNDHIVSGIRLGMDGWLYVAVGDKGIPRATGVDGSTITLRGGGVIRLRPDGTRLEVVASGLRNVLDVAIDEHGELFTYDNTDDGLGWWTRLTHVVHGGEYGYPWLYHDHQDRMLPAMADYGGGSPTGGLVLSRRWPEPFGGSLLFCEWGDQTLRRFEVERDPDHGGATFRVTAMDELAKAGLVPDFRPTDVCESVDGRQLFVADWGYGGWTASDVTGRLWRIRMADDPPLARPLSLISQGLGGMDRLVRSPSSRERLEAHRWARDRRSLYGRITRSLVGAAELGEGDPAASDAVWTTAAALGEHSERDEQHLLLVARGSGDPVVRANAFRALGEAGKLRLPDLDLVDLLDPRVRRAAWRGVARSALAMDDARRGEIAAALFDAIGAEEEPWVRIPLGQALRELDAWDAVARRVLEDVERTSLRSLDGLRQAYDPSAVQALRAAARQADSAAVRIEAGGLLGELYKRPSPWDGIWWGTQPARTPPPPHDVAWECTVLIERLMRDWLATPRAGGASTGGRAMSAVALEGIRRAGDPELGRALSDSLLASFADTPPSTGELLESLRVLAAVKTDAPELVAAVLERTDDEAARDAAIELALAVRSEGMADALLGAARGGAPGVRARALEALSELGHEDAGALCAEALDSDSDEVVRAACAGLGRVGATPELAALLDLAAGRPLPRGPGVAEAAVLALARQPDADALDAYLIGLGSLQPGVRDACRRAVVAVRDEVRGKVEAWASAGALSSLALGELRRAYSGLTPVVRWEVLGPFAEGDVPEVQAAPDAGYVGADAGAGELAWIEALGEGEHGRVELNARLAPNDHVSAFARAAVVSPRARRAEVAVGSDDGIEVWVNGERVFRHADPRGWTPDSDRFTVELVEGVNRLLVRVDEVGGDWAFSVKVAEEGEGPLFDPELNRRTDSERDAYARANRGDPARGREIFFDPDGPGCMRCHVVGGEGRQFGPDLSDAGARFPRVYLIRSVLAPSDNMESHYKAVGIELEGGSIVTGLVLREDADAVVLVDAAGTETKVPAARIVDRWDTGLSAMPTGLADGLSLQDFADLVGFLESLR